MAIDVKPYGKVYKHITEAVEDSFGKYTLPWKYNKTVSAILKSVVEEYKADDNYPVKLHEALSDVVLRWCFEGYPQTEKEDLMAIFKELWKFQKKWMLIAETHSAGQITKPMNTEAVNAIETLCSGINKELEIRKNKITDLYVIVMTHVIDMSLPEEGGE